LKRSITPKLEILPEAQRRLWDELSATPSEFVLYGGTSLALQLGHRQSEDFDFFCLDEIDPAELYGSVSYLDGARIIQRERNTLTCLVDRGGPVKVSFFGLPKLKRIGEPLVAEANGLALASLLDLAGTKVEVVQHRAQAKDYVDIDALMTDGGIDLATQLSAGKAVFGDVFVAIASLKALTYFEEGDLDTVPMDTRDRLVRAVAEVDPLELPDLAEVIKTREGRQG